MRISDWSSDVCSSDLPFTPVPGPRLLLRDAALAPALIAGIEAVVDQHGLSSAHARFVAPAQVPLFEAAGWLIRQGTQFHSSNRGYRCSADFLGQLASPHRNPIRHERAPELAIATTPGRERSWQSSETLR